MRFAMGFGVMLAVVDCNNSGIAPGALSGAGGSVAATGGTESAAAGGSGGMAVGTGGATGVGGSAGTSAGIGGAQTGDGGSAGDAPEPVRSFTGRLGRWSVVDDELCWPLIENSLQGERMNDYPFPSAAALVQDHLVIFYYDAGSWYSSFEEMGTPLPEDTSLLVCSAPFTSDGMLGEWKIASDPIFIPRVLGGGLRTAKLGNRLFVDRGPRNISNQTRPPSYTGGAGGEGGSGPLYDRYEAWDVPLLMLTFDVEGNVTDTVELDLPVGGHLACNNGDPASPSHYLLGGLTADMSDPVPESPNWFLASGNCGRELAVVPIQADGSHGEWTTLFASDPESVDPNLPATVDIPGIDVRYSFGAVSRCGRFLVATGVLFTQTPMDCNTSTNTQCYASFSTVSVASLEEGSRGWRTAPYDLPYSLSYHTSLCTDGMLFLFGGRSFTVYSNYSNFDPHHQVIGARINLQSGEISDWYEASPELPFSDYITNFPFRREGKIYIFVGGGTLTVASLEEGEPVVGGFVAEDQPPSGSNCHAPNTWCSNYGVCVPENCPYWCFDLGGVVCGATQAAATYNCTPPPGETPPVIHYMCG